MRLSRWLPLDPSCEGSQKGYDASTWQPAHGGGASFDFAPAARTRVLPQGAYDVLGYRVHAEDAQRRPWFLSVTGKKLASFTVENGKTSTLPLDDQVRLSWKLVRSTSLQAALQGVGGAGMSLYRDGRRIPLEYVLLDEGEEEVARGSLKYG